MALRRAVVASQPPGFGGHLAVPPVLDGLDEGVLHRVGREAHVTEAGRPARR